MQPRDPPEPFENAAISVLPDRRIVAIAAAECGGYEFGRGGDRECITSEVG
jgi:hypothetical protein